ncbi:hypothetical protein Sden_1077 [Shewanella denitrificans OS217]|jgi:hypothetical protein|uniref:Uncharacterized protein n=1 Tax=Shewanella denitrificans (strain OS217 / ATCC BAA-1090 / DSM 15013) TaxID=318161 RepID=Q12QB1_SHEDO|nr:ABC transporter permease subunit [Shewanella denitrificans]ABE54365.1 hypothetical protein Sden_1077 [Shewanella denitrificans OS217]
MSQTWQSIIADLKQRTRQQSFMVSLLAMSVLTLLFFPSPDAHYQTLVLNGYRGIYNSAWIGVCLAMLNVMFLPIICFYLVKNAIEVDRQSNTFELIASTPISKQAYLFAKWSVNVFIQVCVVLVMLLTSILIQFYYGESYQIDLWALAWPQLVFVLPLLFAIASIALLFESIKWLKGGLGNIIYFFMWIGSVTYTIESVSGVGALLAHLEAEVVERFPAQAGVSNIGINISDETREINTFVWQGLEPTLSHLWGGMPLVVISFGCFMLAWGLFNRFSQALAAEHQGLSPMTKTLQTKVSRALDPVFIALTRHFAFTRLLRLELKLLLKGHSIYWLLGLLVLNVIQLVIEQQMLMGLLLPISWLWCVLVISQLGQQEKQANTLELMSYSRQSSSLQTLASFSAAWLLLAMASCGGMLRLVSMAEWLLLVQLVVAISFSVALAYFCGTLSGTKRLFEVLYPTLWYIGPIQTALYVDFFGVNSQSSWQAGVPYYFGAISISLLLLTVSLRNRRLSS